MGEICLFNSYSKFTLPGTIKIVTVMYKRDKMVIKIRELYGEEI